MAFRIFILCLYLFFLSTSLSSSLNPLQLCNPHDSSALLQFKNSLSLNHSASIDCDEFSNDYYPYNIHFKNISYPKTTLWGNDSNCCLWDGITCDSLFGHVIGLDLSCSWLQGQLHPNNSIFQLSYLQTLNLAYNDFSGSLISSQFGDLSTLLHLNLSSSHFIGAIPPKIAELSKLISLDLSWNYIFSNEQLSLKLEPLSWEKIVLNMTHLRELVLDDVDMSSIAPSHLSMLMNLSSSLVYLSLQYTWLYGNLANNIFHLQNLQKLDLSWNENLMGQLPNSIGHLKSLNFLRLKNCHFDRPIPASFENLTHLTYLNLASNNFSGELSFLSNLKSLTSLDLTYNSFIGGLPNSIGHLKSLNFLSLKYCQFDGSIPASFENLTHLTYLNLASNNFSGELSFLSNLQSLTSLDLSDNYFSGEIPYMFGNHTKLEVFSISRNNFKGNFPQSIFSLVNISSLSLSYNNLSGSINFHQFSKFQKLEILDLSNNKFLSLAYDNNLNYTIPNLITLDLSSCHITIFPKFLGLPNLENLFLDDNELQGIPESLFGFLNLYRLYLSSNNLRGPISLHQFSKLQNLEVLELSNNKFLSLSFENNLNFTIPYLYTLGLSSCDINDFPRQLGNLQNLKTLYLSNNTIHGNIPKWFNDVGNGSLQYLYLSHNNLTSVEHLSMRKFKFLDLSFNMLQGNLPIPSFGVEFLSVSNNKFSGHISSLFCNASSLVILNLSHNNLSGHIPECLIAFPDLESLDLQMNNFVGRLPNSFSRSNSLQSLHLNNNQFEGRLPLSLTHCEKLETLDVGENMIEDEFPNWLDGLSELQVLILRDNKFYGAIYISNTKHPFPMLRIFDVSNNHISGTLPTAYIKEFKGMMEIDYAVGLDYMRNNYSSVSYKESVKVTLKGNQVQLERILTTLTSIDLSNNMFDGEIPQVIGKLYLLKRLNLSHNKITGHIPRSIANLTNLEWLDLSSNILTDVIPLTLVNLNSLEVLNLSHNQLVGEIPRGKQFNTFSNDSYEGNLWLCGFPLSKACNPNEGKFPQPTSSTDDKFGFGWKPIAMGYGCGMVFGMFMGQVVFLIGKPEWLVRIFQARPKKQAKTTRKRTHPNQRRVN